MPVLIIPHWYGSGWIQQALREEDIMLAGAAPGGTFTLFSQQPTGSSIVADTTTQTLGVQFTVAQPGSLAAIWFYSAPGAGSLPVTIGLFAVSGRTLIASQAAAWSGAAGSGWVRAPFTSPPALAAGTAYKACIFANQASNYYSIAAAGYWSTGPGAAGITSGPLSAPDNAGGDGGQDTFTVAAALSYPASSFNANNYWIDPEVQI